MIVVCEKCRSRLRLSESDLNNAPPKLPVRCSRCRHSFTITLPDSLPRNQPVNLPLADETTHNSATIVITNQKGGVAKTSTCLNLGLSLSLMKKSVLLIDFDMQANLTLSLGYQKTSSFYDVFQNGWQKLDSALIQTPYPGLWLLPSNKNMVLLSKKCFGGKDYEFILKSHLSQVQDRFDYIIIDTPPSIEFFTINALSASHLAIIPTQCDYLSVHGVEQVLSFINLIRKKTNPNMKARILVTMYDEASTASRMIFGKLRDLYPERLFQTAIPHDNRLREAQIMNLPVINYDQASCSGLQYLALAREILNPLP